MPENTGKPPKAERVDLTLANGWICRNVKPSHFDWGVGKACAGVPIVRWQVAK